MKREPKVGDVLKFKHVGLEGFFVVEDLWFGGGGTGHGPHDIFPDGLLVYTRKLDMNTGEYDPNGEEFKFTVSGSFGNYIDPKHILVVNKMKRTVTFEW